MFHVEHSERRPSVIAPWQFGSLFEENRVGTADEHADPGRQPWSLTKHFLRVDRARNEKIPCDGNVLGTFCQYFDVRESLAASFRNTALRWCDSSKVTYISGRKIGNRDPRKAGTRSKIENPAVSGSNEAKNKHSQ